MNEDTTRRPSRSASIALLTAAFLGLAACGDGAATTDDGAGGSGSGNGAGNTISTTGASSSTGGMSTPTGCSGHDGRNLCRIESDADWGGTTFEGVRREGGEVILDPAGLTQGTDPNGSYNDGPYFFGTVTSGDLVPSVDFDAAVVSWNATTPDGTWIALEASARVDGTWTDWYRMGVWASGDTDLDRHSFANEGDAEGHVATDTLELDHLADAIRVRALLFSADGTTSPSLRRLSVALAENAAPKPSIQGGMAWGTTLDVPQRSQMMFPDGGEVWCSPTSTSMIMAYWSHKTGDASLDVPVPEAADATYDAVYQGNGNWPFNVAFASSLGLEGAVGWFASAADLEPWIKAGVPVATSLAWGPGELDGAPVSSTDGHLMVVVGFDAMGKVVVNDPAAPTDATVRRTYDRAQFEGAWRGGSGGVAYLMFPAGTTVPW